MKNFLLSPLNNAVLLGVALFLAVMLAARSAAPSDVTGLSLTGSNTSNFGQVVADGVTATNITATTFSAPYITATTALSTAALSVGGYSQSGAVRFGSATFVTTGTLIAHGFGTTPTTIVLTGWGLTNTFTNTIGVLSSNATSFTVAIPGGATVTRLDWMAGK